VLSRLPVLVAVAGLVLAACSNAAQPAGGDAGEEAGAASPEVRTVELPGGPVDVPAEPRRVVVLQSFLVPHVVSLGVTPVGVGLTDPAVDADLDPDVVTFDETAPDLERLAELEPDLFVAFREPPEVEQLEQIAPVADVDRIALEFDELLEGVATVLGAEEEGDRIASAYEQRVERFRDETAPRLEDRTVSTFRVRGPDELRIEVLDSFPGQVLDAAGVARPPVQDVESDDGFGYLEVSGERLDDADADLMFPITYERRPQSRDDLDALASTPLWATLTAVEEDQVFEVDAGAWFGGHPSAGVALLDDLAATVDGDLAPYEGP
jgi:iron complex transport system substrate-binding protein